MQRIVFAAVAALVTAPLMLTQPAVAGPGDHWKKQWELRAECNKKLAEAKNARERRKESAECDKTFTELRFKQREDALKARYEAEKKWLEQQGKYAGRYYDWDD